jgi:hypothetical protein
VARHNLEMKLMIKMSSETANLARGRQCNSSLYGGPIVDGLWQLQNLCQHCDRMTQRFFAPEAIAPPPPMPLVSSFGPR